MRKETKSSESGKSIIELVIVLIVAVILATFAVAQLGNSQNNFKRQNIARELKVYLERARFDSVKRRPFSENEMSRIIVENASSFTVRTDLNQNGAIDASDIRQIDFSHTTTRIVGDGLVFPMTVSFNRFGQIVVRNGAGIQISPPPLILCDNCSATTANVENSNTILISATGTVAMLPGKQVQTIVQNPNVTSVAQNLQIKSSITVDTSSGSSATPTPTPIPTVTPTPVSTPTPTPSATPTATPTPTQACSRNQRPTQDQCICQDPMSVRSNGKCQ